MREKLDKEIWNVTRESVPSNDLKYKTIAVDFDGTLAEIAWPGIGRPIQEAIDVINRYYDAGGEVIIWSCRENQENVYYEMLLWLEKYGVKYNKVNENMEWRVAMYDGIDCRKIGVDLYIDDKQVGGLPPWSEIDKILQERV